MYVYCKIDLSDVTPIKVNESYLHLYISEFQYERNIYLEMQE